MECERVRRPCDCHGPLRRGHSCHCRRGLRDSRLPARPCRTSVRYAAAVAADAAGSATTALKPAVVILSGGDERPGRRLPQPRRGLELLQHRWCLLGCGLQFGLHV